MGRTLKCRKFNLRGIGFCHPETLAKKLKKLPKKSLLKLAKSEEDRKNQAIFKEQASDIDIIKEEIITEDIDQQLLDLNEIYRTIRDLKNELEPEVASGSNETNINHQQKGVEAFGVTEENDVISKEYELQLNKKGKSYPIKKYKSVHLRNLDHCQDHTYANNSHIPPSKDATSKITQKVEQEHTFIDFLGSMSNVTTETTNNLLNNNKQEADNPYKDYCRVCLCTSSESMHSLSEDTIYHTNLKDILQKLFNSQIDLGSEPTNICLKCKEKLIEFYKFKQQFEESHHILQKVSTQTKRTLNIPEKSDNIVEKLSTHKKKTLNKAEQSNNLLKQASNAPKELSVPTITRPLENEFTVVRTILTKSNAVNVNTKYKCGICAFQFTKFKLFQEHIKTCNTQFKCSICDKRFMDQYVLLRHEKNHEILKNKKEQPTERKHLCITCGKRLASRRSLLAHSRIHSGEKPYTCEVCNKSFTHWYTLQDHKVCHTGEKSCICEYCGKTFYRRNALRVHKASHENKRKYPCSICDKRFNFRNAQTRHIATHSGTKEFQCDNCGKAFNRKSNLIVHNKMHTVKQNKYYNSLCNEKYK